MLDPDEMNADPQPCVGLLTVPVDEDGDVVAVLVAVRVLMADYLVDVVAAPRAQAQLPRTWVSLPHKEHYNLTVCYWYRLQLKSYS
jgi:hypothetical protein